MLIRNECTGGETTQITMYECREEPSTTVGNLRLTDGQTTIGELNFTSSNNKMLIEGIFVKPSYRERGFGTRLLKMAEEIAAEHNLRQICLKPSPIDTVNLEALRDWYQRRGYTSSSFNLMKKPVSA